jgi:hypothetical protein
LSCVRSDFIYMVPPSLAYYGVITQNESMVKEAYTQVKLYRNYLRDKSANSLWKHVLMGSPTDEGHWSTGPSCFSLVAGECRVLTAWCGRERLGRGGHAPRRGNDQAVALLVVPQGRGEGPNGLDERDPRRHVPPPRTSLRFC